MVRFLKYGRLRVILATWALQPTIVKSYTPQSADLIWLMIELMTLDISGMGYGKIAERVA